jgi:hypothetical protein
VQVTGESVQARKRSVSLSEQAERERLGRLLKQAFPLGKSGSFTGVIEGITMPCDEQRASQTARDGSQRREPDAAKARL